MALPHKFTISLRVHSHTLCLLKRNMCWTTCMWLVVWRHYVTSLSPNLPCKCCITKPQSCCSSINLHWSCSGAVIPSKCVLLLNFAIPLKHSIMPPCSICTGLSGCIPGFIWGMVKLWLNYLLLLPPTCTCEWNLKVCQVALKVKIMAERPL